MTRPIVAARPGRKAVRATRAGPGRPDDLLPFHAMNVDQMSKDGVPSFGFRQGKGPTFDDQYKKIVAKGKPGFVLVLVIHNNTRTGLFIGDKRIPRDTYPANSQIQAIGKPVNDGAVQPSCIVLVSCHAAGEPGQPLPSNLRALVKAIGRPVMAPQTPASVVGSTIRAKPLPDDGGSPWVMVNTNGSVVYKVPIDKPFQTLGNPK